jgi:hypothetical protein
MGLMRNPYKILTGKPDRKTVWDPFTGVDAGKHTYSINPTLH